MPPATVHGAADTHAEEADLEKLATESCANVKAEDRLDLCDQITCAEALTE